MIPKLLIINLQAFFYCVISSLSKLLIICKMVYFVLVYFLAIRISLGDDCWVPQTDIIMFDIYSDNTIELVDSNNNYLKNALVCTRVWSGSPRIPNIDYICDNNDTLSEGIHYFRTTFNIIGTPIEGILMLAADDLGKSTINGNGELCNWANYATLATCNVLPYLKSGFNVALMIANNMGFGGGLTFKLSIKSQI